MDEETKQQIKSDLNIISSMPSWGEVGSTLLIQALPGPLFSAPAEIVSGVMAWWSDPAEEGQKKYLDFHHHRIY
jgi:hypothetical protein